MSPEERLAIRALHAPLDVLGRHMGCRACGSNWPCDAVALLDDLERAEAADSYPSLVKQYEKLRLTCEALVGERDALRAVARDVLSLAPVHRCGGLPCKWCALDALLASVGLPEGKPQPPLNAGESLNLALKTIEEMAAEGKP